MQAPQPPPPPDSFWRQLLATADAGRQGAFRPAPHSDADAHDAERLRHAADALMHSLWLAYAGVLAAERPAAKSIAFRLGRAKLYVWALLGDDDDEARYHMFDIDARVSGQFTQHGLDVQTSIVTPRNGFDLPPVGFIPYTHE